MSSANQPHSDVINALRQFIDWNKVDGGNLVISCSGGLDSIVLAHASITSISQLARQDFWRNDPPAITLWHLRHRIRENDLADADFVRKTAKQWNVSAVIEEVDVPASRRPGIDSMESAARRMRYEGLMKFLRGIPGGIAFTAHHADDNAETILFNLLRGTGPAGLRGISPIYMERIFRPLLGVTALQIRQYADDNGLDWQEDPSNRDTGLRRNYIRHEIMPRLLEVNNASVAHINRLATLADDLIRRTPQTTFDFEYTSGDELCQRLPLLACPDVEFGLICFMPDHLENLLSLTIAGALRRINCPVNYDLISELHCGLTGKRDAHFFGDWQFRFHGNGLMSYVRLHIVDLPELPPVVSTSLTPMQLDEDARHRLIKSKQLMGPQLTLWWDWLDEEDFDSEQGSVWMVILPVDPKGDYEFRVRRNGDRITLPNGATRKVGDVFTDVKVPEYLRDGWALLVDAKDNVVWIPGIADSKRMHELHENDEYVLACVKPLE